MKENEPNEGKHNPRLLPLYMALDAAREALLQESMDKNLPEGDRARLYDASKQLAEAMAMVGAAVMGTPPSYASMIHCVDLIQQKYGRQKRFLENRQWPDLVTDQVQ